MTKREKDFDYKVGYYSHKFFELQMPFLKIVGAVFAIVFIAAIVSKYTPYYHDVREFLGDDSSQWFLKAMIGFGVYTMVLMFVGVAAFMHELDGGDIDE